MSTSTDKPKKRKKKAAGYYLSKDLIERIREESEATGISASELVERAIESDLQLGIARKRLCPTCGACYCDHGRPAPQLGRLLKPGQPVMVDGVDLRSYTQAVWNLATRGDV